MDLKSQVEKSAREHKPEKFKQEVIEQKARNKNLIIRYLRTLSRPKTSQKIKPERNLWMIKRNSRKKLGEKF